MSIAREPVTSEDLQANRELIADIEELGFLSEFTMNISGSPDPEKPYKSVYLSSLTLPVKGRCYNVRTELLVWHPVRRKVVNFPVTRFPGLKEAAYEALGKDFFFTDGKKNVVTYTHSEIIAVLRQLKTDIASCAERHNVEPSDDNIAKLLALGYMFTLGAPFNIVKENISYRSSHSTAWKEALKYVADGYEVQNILDLFSLQSTRQKVGYPQNRGGVHLFVSHETATEYSLKDVPPEWAEVMLSIHFGEDVRMLSNT